MFLTVRSSLSSFLLLWMDQKLQVHSHWHFSLLLGHLYPSSEYREQHFMQSQLASLLEEPKESSTKDANLREVFIKSIHYVTPAECNYRGKWRERYLSNRSIFQEKYISNHSSIFANQFVHSTTRVSCHFFLIFFNILIFNILIFYIFLIFILIY